MRRGEIEYWDKHFSVDGMFDNVWKRQQIVRRLLSFPLVEKRVLEVGFGFCTTFYSINVILMNSIKYYGIDTSGEAVTRAKENLGMNVEQATISNIPCKSGDFDYVVALDVLEHIHPHDRPLGYREIDRTLAPSGFVILNQPLAETKHDLDYDHGFSMDDLVELMETTGTRIFNFERYEVTTPNGIIPYTWIVLHRDGEVKQ